MRRTEIDHSQTRLFSTRQLLWCVPLSLVLLVATFLASVYYVPRTKVLSINPDYLGYYHGLGLHNGNGLLGKKWYRIHVDEGDVGYWEVDMNGYGYSSYRGYYRDGTLKEKGICLVEENGSPGGDPAPDRHQITEGEFYDPQGSLIGKIHNGTGHQVLHFPDGTKSWELELNQGKRIEHFMYHATGAVASNHAYDSDERPHGPYLSNYENGVPRARGQYESGKEVGVWYRFHENGSIESIEDFRSDPSTIEKFDPGEKTPPQELDFGAHGKRHSALAS